MPAARNLTRQDIERAQKHTKSNHAAAKFLGCSYNTYKLYAKMYLDEDTKQTLFDKHENRSGKGIPKWGNNGRDIPIDEIMNGSAPRYSYDATKLKNILLAEQKLVNHCYKCGFCEERVIDYKVPLLLNFKDKNDKNWQLNNLELLCYNCYFINVGDVFTSKQIKGIEDGYTTTPISETSWELEEEYQRQIEEAELQEWDEASLTDYIAWEEKDDDEDENKYISYL
jgi:hypothetical protein